MTTRPKSMDWAMASPIIVVGYVEETDKHPTFWLTLDVDGEKYAEELFNALSYILDGDVALEAVTLKGSTVSMRMKRLPGSLEEEG